MAIDSDWKAVQQGLDRLSAYQVLQRTVAAMRRLVHALQSDPRFAGVRPTLSHATLVLSEPGSAQRVCVGWDDEQFEVAFLGPLMEISDGVRAHEDAVVRVVHEHLMRSCYRPN